MTRSLMRTSAAAAIAWAVTASGGRAQAPPAEPELGLVAVRDVAPAGSPAQVPPLPPARRTFTPICGAEAPSPPRSIHNLLRWSFGGDLGFPPGGFDLYRCCGTASAPPAGNSAWTKLNSERIRPPRTNAEGLAFVSGTGPMPDQGRQVLQPRMRPEEWAAFCRLLQDATGAPADCPALPPQPVPDPDAVEIHIEQDSLATLLLTSLRPEIAAMLGLYWVDDKGDAEGCFYRVEGFWGEGMRQALTGPVVPAVLPPPTGLTLEQTPLESGLSCASLGGPEARPPVSSEPAIQLRWDLADSFLRPSAAEAAVAYNVCRRGPSESGFTQINAEPYEAAGSSFLVEVPIIVPRVPVLDERGRPVLGASGRPETKLPRVFYEDRLGDKAVAGGTYAYRVNALNIFGIESDPSAPASRTLVDAVGPPPPVNLLAEVEAVMPPTAPPTARVTLRFDWTGAQMERARDTVAFQVYRRVDRPDLEVVAGCPVFPSSGIWMPVGPPIPVDGYAARYATQGELPTADHDTFGDLLPVQRYQVVDTLALPPGPPVRNFYYRVVAVDARSNVGGPSGPAIGWVVDNAPATPPDRLIALFSRSDWDDTVQVHLLWPAPSPAGNLGGFKVLRSVRAPACTKDDECPAEVCDDQGCAPLKCISGFCGGADAGPTDRNRQEDREAMLTNGLEPFQAGPLPVEWAKLRSLAALGNLYRRDPATGAPVLAAPGCRLPDPDPACETELEDAVAGTTQYRQDVLPRKAAGQVYFYRIMAVSQAGIQESGGVGPGSLSNAFPVQAPDFVAPAPPDLQSALTRIAEDAVEIAWPVTTEKDALAAGAGYTVLRAELTDAAGEPELVANTGSFRPAGLAADRCYRFDVRRIDEVNGAVGSPLATVHQTGAAAVEIVWPAPDGLAQVAIERREGVLAPIHTSRLLPGPASQTIDGLEVRTEHFGAPVASLRVKDRPPEAERNYCYALLLTDRAGNASRPSQAQIGRRVDILPPAPPETLRVGRTGGEVEVRWGHAEADLRVTVKRSSSGFEGPWRTLAAAETPREVPDETTLPATLDVWHTGSGSKYRFRDSGAQPKRAYWYRIELHDAAGNKSGRNDGVVELEKEK